MGRMVVEPQSVVQDREIRMIQLEKMLETATSLVRRCFHIVDLDTGDRDWLGGRPPEAKCRERKGRKRGKHGSGDSIT